MSFGMFINGGAELERKLKNAGRRVARKAVTKALRKEAKAIATDAKAILKSSIVDKDRSTGFLARGIKVRALKRSRRWFGMSAGIGKGYHKGDQFYGWFRERGAGRKRLQADPGADFAGRTAREESRMRERAKGHPGQPARPFLQPAFDRRKAGAASRIPEEIRRELEAELAKGIK